MWPCFAGLVALVPGVKQLDVTSTSAASKPRTTATTTTDFSRFLDDAALGTYQTDCRRRDCTCVYIQTCIKTKREKARSNRSLLVQHEGVVGIGLTFAGLHALKPAVISVAVAGTSAVFIPSTSRSTTTGSGGVLECTTLWAHHIASRGDGYCVRTDRCADLRANYF